MVSFEELTAANLLAPNEVLTIENIPHHLLRPIPSTVSSDKAKSLAQTIIQELLTAAEMAASEWRKDGDQGGAGFAEVVIEDGLAEFTRAGMELGLLKPMSGIHPFGSGGYWVKGVPSTCKTQCLGEREAAARAALQVILKHFPDLSARIWTRYD